MQVQSLVEKWQTFRMQYLTVDDLTLAKRTIVSLVQHQSFPEELQDLKRKDKNRSTCEEIEFDCEA